METHLYFCSRSFQHETQGDKFANSHVNSWRWIQSTEPVSGFACAMTSCIAGGRDQPAVVFRINKNTCQVDTGLKHLWKLFVSLFCCSREQRERGFTRQMKIFKNLPLPSLLEDERTSQVFAVGTSENGRLKTNTEFTNIFVFNFIWLLKQFLYRWFWGEFAGIVLRRVVLISTNLTAVTCKNNFNRKYPENIDIVVKYTSEKLLHLYTRQKIQVSATTKAPISWSNWH